MLSRPRDPLLTAARIALLVTAGFCALSALFLAFLVPTLLIFNESVMEQIALRGAPSETIWAVVGATALSAVVSGLGFLFLRHLYRIVESVRDGDPFIPVNATRLQAMGWLSLAVHVLGVPLAATTGWLGHILGIGHMKFEVSWFGLLLALVLFILARVFRQGARMREELDGTV
ncbi:MAG: DUF2975 domain-containing protein [Novosphingobium sp.]